MYKIVTSLSRLCFQKLQTTLKGAEEDVDRFHDGTDSHDAGIYQNYRQQDHDAQCRGFEHHRTGQGYHSWHVRCPSPPAAFGFRDQAARGQSHPDGL